jgi:hypothetical protein
LVGGDPDHANDQQHPDRGTQYNHDRLAGGARGDMRGYADNGPDERGREAYHGDGDCHQLNAAQEGGNGIVGANRGNQDSTIQVHGCRAQMEQVRHRDRQEHDAGGEQGQSDEDPGSHDVADPGPEVADPRIVPPAQE